MTRSPDEFQTVARKTGFTEAEVDHDVDALLTRSLTACVQTRR